MNTITGLKKELKSLADYRQAKILSSFSKTGKGEYGEGDKFLGIKVPIQRKIAKQYKELSLRDLEKLLNSKIHDYRQIALFILIDKYNRSEARTKKEIFSLYLKNTNHINNWDLVDSSAPHIVGNYLIDKSRNVLYKFAKSKNLWERRIAMLSTYAFIKNNDFIDTLKISRILLTDSHDLIHKAVGWMLREVGNRNREAEEIFLKKHYRKMPRTMLRYAIEKFPENKRKFYLKK